MTAFTRQHLLPASIALILTILIVNSSTFWRDIYYRTIRCITWGEAVLATPVVAPGETLKITYQVKVNKQCPSDLRTFIMAPDGSAAVRFPPIFGGYNRASGEWQEIKVSVVVPPTPDPSQPNWIEGDYIYRTIATRYCPEGVEVDAAVPDVPFRLKVL